MQATDTVSPQRRHRGVNGGATVMMVEDDAGPFRTPRKGSVNMESSFLRRRSSSYLMRGGAGGRGRRRSTVGSDQLNSSQLGFPHNRFAVAAHAVVAAIRMMRFVHGPSALTRTERQRVEKLYYASDSITTWRDVGYLVTSAGYTVVDEAEVRRLFQPCVFNFDGKSGRQLELREAQKILSKVKRLQHEQVSSAGGHSDAAVILEALRHAAEMPSGEPTPAPSSSPTPMNRRGHHHHSRTRSGGWSSKHQSGATTPAASSSLALGASAQMTSAHPVAVGGAGRLTLRNLRRVVADKMGLPLDVDVHAASASGGLTPAQAHLGLPGSSAPAGGADDDRDLAEGDIDQLLSAPDVAKHGRRRRRVSVRSDGPPGSGVLPGGPDGGMLGTSGRRDSDAVGDVMLLTPTIGSLDGPTGGGAGGGSGAMERTMRFPTVDGAGPDVMLPSHLQDRDSLDDDNDEEDDTEIGIEAKTLRSAALAIAAPDSSVARVRPTTKQAAVNRHEGRIPAAAKGRLFPKLHHRATTYTMREFETILDAQDHKEAGIAYVPKKKPNCTVSFAGAAPLARFTAVESVAATRGANGGLEYEAFDDNMDPDASRAERAARRRRQEEAAEKQRLTIERLKVRSQTPISRDLPRWKQAWKAPPKIAKVRDPCRHVKATNFTRLCGTPSFSLEAGDRMAAIQSGAEQFRSATAMAEYTRRQLQPDDDDVVSGGGDEYSPPAQPRRAASTGMLPALRSVAAAACRAMDERRGVRRSPDRRNEKAPVHASVPPGSLVSPTSPDRQSQQQSPSSVQRRQTQQPRPDRDAPAVPPPAQLHELDGDSEHVVAPGTVADPPPAMGPDPAQRPPRPSSQQQQQRPLAVQRRRVSSASSDASAPHHRRTLSKEDSVPSVPVPGTPTAEEL